MRLLYGVFGYGRGHATRALAVLPELRRRHEVVVFAGGDAHDALVGQVPLVRIPTLTYVYGDEGRRSMARTLRHNAGRFRDVVLGGEGSREVVQRMADFRPDVAICDAEPWTHHAAARLGVPRISFDHFGVLAWCRAPLSRADRLLVRRDLLTYRLLIGRPDRVLVSSFFPALPRRGHVQVIPPLLREAVHQVAEAPGEHLLVYLNRGQAQLTPAVEAALGALGLPVLVYGTDRRGSAGSLVFRPPADLPFLADLARSVAVVSTAGNQLVGEAMHYGKPLLVMPENSVEQRVNALAIERLGIGERCEARELSPRRLAAFLAQVPRHAARARALRRDGRAEAVAALEALAAELQRARRPRPGTLMLGAWKFA
jgi:uncharacterized protein (TIGR00661 family)